ncbi:MAG: hypothetical protein AAGJ87_07590 [Pseudomonadota bacterium]
MIRTSMILLCLVLGAAAAGRYQAEVRVKKMRQEIQQLEAERSSELSKIRLLRAEVAYLESPERLAVIAERATKLEQMTSAQLLTADDFIIAFGDAPRQKPDRGAPDRDVIQHAIAMADAAAGRP